MKKIGFIDYYISEWHANNYPSWIKEASKKLGVEYEVAYAWAELDRSPKYNETTDEWCARMGVEKCDTIEELCEKSDVIVVLAPSDPEKHLGYAKVALTYKKPTYIDKTFAPDLSTALAIKNIADKEGTCFFSTSALRYAEELATDFVCREMMTTGSGSNLPEYIIHQIEMVVVKLGIGASRIKADALGSKTLFTVEYCDGRLANMMFAPSIPFTVYMSGNDAKPVYKKADSPYFQYLMEDIVRFFKEGTTSFPVEETVEVMKIREGAIRATESIGEWIDLDSLKK